MTDEGSTPDPEFDGEPVSVVLSAKDADLRLDRVLAQKELGVSRSQLQQWMRAGRVLIDGVSVRGKYTARLGDVVEVFPAEPPPSAAEPEAIPLVILHQDEDLVVVDKQAGLVVHPGPGHPSGTLVNGILHHAPVTLAQVEGEADGAALQRPGIVHRLDKDTSGVMVVARSGLAKARLVEAFQRREVERRYLALAAGRLESCRIEAPIGRHPKDRKRFSSVTGRGKPAVTHVTQLAQLAGATKVACRLETGRTHQIRVHLADRGHPLIGDPVYGSRRGGGALAAAGKALGRQALHAAYLGFVHPRTGRPMSFETPPPDDFARALIALEET